MKRHLNNLEAAVNAVEDVLEADARMIVILRRAWRSEYQSRRSDEEQEYIMGVNRCSRRPVKWAQVIRRRLAVRNQSGPLVSGRSKRTGLAPFWT